MKTSDYLILGAVALGGYVLYKTFGPNPEAAANALKNSATSYRTPTQEEIKRGWNAGKSSIITMESNKKGNTTYFWTQEELNKINGFQRFLLNLKVPQSVIFR